MIEPERNRTVWTKTGEDGHTHTAHLREQWPGVYCVSTDVMHELMLADGWTLRYSEEGGLPIEGGAPGREGVPGRGGTPTGGEGHA